MYLVVKQQIKHLKVEEYNILRELCRASKNLYNQAIYEIRKIYKEEKRHLHFSEIDTLLRSSENYKMLYAQTAQQTLRCVDKAYSSFFGLLHSEAEYKQINEPNYLNKNGYYKLINPCPHIKRGIFNVPYSRLYDKRDCRIKIKIPPILKDKVVKQVWIIPKQNAKFFEIQYVYEIKDFKGEIPIKNVLAIDFGINNLCTCVTNGGKSFIIDGKKLKSYNQWYNKRISELKSIKAHQRIKEFTFQMYKIVRKRNNRFCDYINKSAKYIIDYCIRNNIDTIVCGVNKDFQRNSNLGKVNNQIFTEFPFSKLKNNIEYRSKLNKINFIEQEESYTSKASFFDKDFIPTYGESFSNSFSGLRVKRGLYKTSSGMLLNADVNGALNILRKSNVVSLNTLYSRGELDTPMRISII